MGTFKKKVYVDNLDVAEQETANALSFVDQAVTGLDRADQALFQVVADSEDAISSYQNRITREQIRADKAREAALKNERVRNKIRALVE